MTEEQKEEKKEPEQKNEKKGLKRQACEVFSRVVGYIRPVHQWNPGKQSEFKDRKMLEHGCDDENKDNKDKEKKE